MSHPPDSSQFRAALKEIFTEATKDGKSSVAVKAGDLHKQVGGYPEPKSNHRMPICCEVMYHEMGNRDEIMHSPQKRKRTSLTIRYDLPKGGEARKERRFFARLFRRLISQLSRVMSWWRGSGLNMKRGWLAVSRGRLMQRCSQPRCGASTGLQNKKRAKPFPPTPGR